MAIAGLHNVPAVESSILRESQSSSSTRRGSQGRISTQASSILQMWRELEDECAVNRGRERGRLRSQQEGSHGLPYCPEGEGTQVLEDSDESDFASVHNSVVHVDPLNENEDHQSVTSEQSQDFGEVERERVRQIFREWMNSGVTPQTPNVSRVNRNSRAQLLGETERERVRIVREWIEMTSQQREPCLGNREEQVIEIGSQIERVREGQVPNNNEGQSENNRREIRRLCGRQALLDLLAKKEQERLQELHGLKETRPVSSFPHRNRIQSLLRIRCFQNMRSTEMRRPSSAAESELGLLRQRQTVSGLREGFLSRFDNNVHVQESDPPDAPSDNNVNSSRDDLTQGNSAIEVLDGAVEHVPAGNDDADPTADLNQLSGCSIREINSQESAAHVEERLELALDDGGSNRQEIATIGNLNASDGGVQARLEQAMDNSGENRQETATIGHVEERLEHALEDGLWNRQEIGTIGHLNTSDVDNGGENGQETATIGHSNASNDRNQVMSSQEPPITGSVEFRDPEESHETSHQQFDIDREVNARNQSDDVEGHVAEDVNGQEPSPQVEDWQEQVTEYEEGEWEGSVLSNRWRDDDQMETDEQRWQDDGEELSHGAIENADRERNDVQEDYWHEVGSQETPRDWLAMPSEPGATSFGRADPLYFSDEDNMYNMELRELLNRRRVSSLLHSGFRESLDQLIQSYVERQAQVPDDWEIHEMSPPPFAARNQEQLGIDHNEESTAEERSQRLLPIPPPAPHSNWGRSLHHTNSSRHQIYQRPGTEWEIINDLRMDMARLQQRLNNMQRMLEACMDMQLELQRSVRQEVSAALNRSVNPSDSLKNMLPKSSFEWDYVRKGMCCICATSNIDSLLYRCGHMCTCQKCANVLVEGNGKCPMCEAPVVEVIRAYFT